MHQLFQRPPQKTHRFGIGALKCPIAGDMNDAARQRFDDVSVMLLALRLPRQALRKPLRYERFDPRLQLIF